MEKDLVSIIVPIYNVEPYMEKCIDTIIEQSYKKLEIILVDDGSTDNSGKIADMYIKKDSRIKVIHKINGGLSDARNAGMEQAKGKYICFIDSDDFIEKDMIKNMINKINSLNVDVIIGGYYVDFEDKNGNLKKRRVKKFEKEGYFDKNIVNQEVLGMLGYAWNKMYRLDFLKNNNFYFVKGLSLVEDTEFNSRVLAKAKIGLDAGIYNHYIQRNRETLGNKKYDNLLELNIRLSKCHEYLLRSWKTSEEKIEEIKIKDYLSILKGYIKNKALEDIKYSKSIIEDLLKNNEINKAVNINKYKNIKDRVFCFLVKHKMVLILRSLR